MSSAHDAPVLTAESMATYRRHVREAAAFLRDRMSGSPSLGLVVATGRETFPEALVIEDEWSVDAIPHFPVSDDGGGTLAVGTCGQGPIVVLGGPPSLCDGYTARQVAFPVRMLGEAGIETLLFTNTVGSVNADVEPSDLLLVTDHINFQGVNPLVGPNVGEWGPRFPDMSEPYDSELRQVAEKVALSKGIKLQKGIYFASLGPNLGTPAEYRMVRTLGADVVGTNTVQEIIAARHMDLRVMTLSVITDRCSPDAVDPISTGAMVEALETARPQLRRLLSGVIAVLEGEDVPAA